MAATGLVRKMGLLGRVAIPRDIIRLLGIEPGQAMEFFTGDNGEIILAKRPQTRK